MQDLDVIVVGAIGIDTNVFSDGPIDLSSEGHFSRNVDYVGQAGAYAARGYARLGYPTAFLGYVGDDPLGEWIARELREDGIEPLLFADPAGTRRSINLMGADGHRCNFYDGRGAMEVRPDVDACRPLLARARLAHVHIENWARFLLPEMRALGLTVACDVQDTPGVDDPYRRDFLAAADVIFFSTALLSGPEEFIRACHKLGYGRVLVAGMGAQGCAYAERGEIRRFPPVDLPLPLVDTNGAGDGLAVGYLSARYLDGLSAEAAVTRGQVVARYTCSVRASTANLIDRATLSRYVASVATQ